MIFTFEEEELGQESCSQVDRSRSRGGSCHGGGEEEREEHAGEVQQDGLDSDTKDENGCQDTTNLYLHVVCIVVVMILTIQTLPTVYIVYLAGCIAIMYNSCCAYLSSFQFCKNPLHYINMVVEVVDLG